MTCGTQAAAEDGSASRHRQQLSRTSLQRAWYSCIPDTSEAASQCEDPSERGLPHAGGSAQNLGDLVEIRVGADGHRKPVTHRAAPGAASRVSHSDGRLETCWDRLFRRYADMHGGC